MRESDLAEVVRIEQRAYPFPWPEQQFRHCLGHDFVCQVLERNGVIEGYAVMGAKRNGAHIMNLCVRPESQGQGLGTRRLRHRLGPARRRGLKYAFPRSAPVPLLGAPPLYRRGLASLSPACVAPTL